MTAPNMATLTASLERSLRNCSLNHSPSLDASASSSSLSRSIPDDRFQPRQDLSSNSSSSSPSSTSEATTTLVDLNSQISLPYHWEQCLDLQTGEIYYKNWRNGIRAKEDPRLISTTAYSDDDEEEEDEEDEDDDESYDSEESSTTDQYSSPNHNSYRRNKNRAEDVLVVAGCKRCLMYYMVPKHVLDCPKCAGQLLHFERSDNNSSN